jgi:hypothetical protein
VEQPPAKVVVWEQQKPCEFVEGGILDGEQFGDSGKN